MSRVETRRNNERFTPEQDEQISEMKAQHYGLADIALAVNKTAKQVSGRLIYLKAKEGGQVEPSVGWPVPDRKRLNDWGKGFWDENIQEPGTTPRMRQAPINHTVGGVAKYG